jgi:hypothetical protein
LFFRVEQKSIDLLIFEAPRVMRNFIFQNFLDGSNFVVDAAVYKQVISDFGLAGGKIGLGNASPASVIVNLYQGQRVSNEHFRVIFNLKALSEEAHDWGVIFVRKERVLDYFGLGNVNPNIPYAAI